MHWAHNGCLYFKHACVLAGMTAHTELTPIVLTRSNAKIYYGYIPMGTDFYVSSITPVNFALMFLRAIDASTTSMAGNLKTES